MQFSLCFDHRRLHFFIFKISSFQLLKIKLDCERNVVTNEQVDVVVGGVHHGERLPVGQEDTLPLPDPRQGATYTPQPQRINNS
jgi:hypothetical protein